MRLVLAVQYVQVTFLATSSSHLLLVSSETCTGPLLSDRDMQAKACEQGSRTVDFERSGCSNEV